MYGQPSTLEDLARIDVSVMRDEEGAYRYFVNEVARAQDMSMYSSNFNNRSLIKRMGQHACYSILRTVESFNKNRSTK